MSLTITQVLSAPDTETAAPEAESQGVRAPRIQQGNLLADRFLVLRSLGSGGMGEVFEATDQVIGESVAVKVVNSLRSHSGVDRARLLREVQLARRVTHPNVCRTFDLFRHEASIGAGKSKPFDVVSMELLDGVDLGHRLQIEGRYSLEEALPIIRQIARGLYAAHRQGIVHRDLKPGNVMLVKESDGQRAVITDFGLAQLPDVDETLTKASEVLGSPAYMAPEQIAGDAVSPATDVYAFGIMVYQMLTGHLPFVGEGPWLTAISRLHKDPEPATTWVPDLDPRILSILDRCLERVPEDRVDGMESLLEELDFGDPSWNAYGLKNAPNQAVLIESSTNTDALQAAPADAKVAEESASQESASQESASEESASQESASQEAAEPITNIASAALSVSDEVKAPAKPPFLPWAAAFIIVGALLWFGTGLLVDKAPDVTIDSRLLDVDWRTEMRPFATDEELVQIRLGFEQNPEDLDLGLLLLEALRGLGRDEEASAVAERAKSLLPGIEAPARTELEAAIAASTGDLSTARNLYFSLANLYPERPGYWLRYVDTRILIGDRDGLAEKVEARRDTLSPQAQLRLAPLRTLLMPLAEQADVADGIWRQAERIGDQRLMLEALVLLIGSTVRSDRLPEARIAAEQIRLMARDMGPFSQARAANELGLVLWKEGNTQAATAVFQEALDGYREIGSWSGLCRIHNALSVVTRDRSQARAHLEKAIENCRKGGLRSEEALRLYNFASDSKPSVAVESYRKINEIAAELNDEELLGLSQIGLGTLLVDFGETNQGILSLDKAEAIFRKTEPGFGLVSALLSQAVGLGQAGKLSEAQKLLEEVAGYISDSYPLNLHLQDRRNIQLLFEGRYEEAMQAGLAAGEQWGLRGELSSEVFAVTLAIEAGLAAGRTIWAVEELTELLERPGLDVTFVALSYALLAEAHWRRGNVAEALAALANAAEQDIPGYFKALQWRLAILAAHNGGQDSLERLDAAVREAAAAGNRFWQLAAQIAAAGLRGDQKEQAAFVQEARDLRLLGATRFANETGEFASK